MIPSSVSEVTRPTVSVPKVALLRPIYPTELSNCPARVAVGGLEDLRVAVILHKRAWPVDEVAGKWAETAFHRADQRPARGPRNRLLDIDPDHRLADAVRREQPLGAVALLADETVNAVGIRPAGRGAVGT